MRQLLALSLVAALAGCASFSAPQPGISTAELEKRMGKAADTRVHSDGETLYYYPQQPYGKVNYVARVKDGKMIAFEQRLTEENVARLEKGKTRADDVRDLLGPPYKIWPFPRMQRDIWEYRMMIAAAGYVPQGLYVQISPDGVVREVYIENDPDNRLSEGGPPR
jgi:outer membrane protein assembly factor BamE (lipoprotein component of BamABCDE complex)